MDVLHKMSVSGAVLIAVIVIVRALAVNRLPKRLFCGFGPLHFSA